MKEHRAETDKRPATKKTKDDPTTIRLRAAALHFDEDELTRVARLQQRRHQHHFEQPVPPAKAQRYVGRESRRILG